MYGGQVFKSIVFNTYEPIITYICAYVDWPKSAK
jgi:hypothetical protein